jgi:hypothetical protein
MVSLLSSILVRHVLPDSLGTAQIQCCIQSLNQEDKKKEKKEKKKKKKERQT